LKVVAFNAHGGGFVAAILARLQRPPLDNPDVILLSEADWRLRRSARRQVAAELAAELGMSFAYVGEFSIPRPEGKPLSFMGNAILSSLPLGHVRALPMANIFLGRKVRRLLGSPTGIAATIAVNRVSVSLGMVHLNSRCGPRGRELQMRQFLQDFPQEGAAIIGGDFNTTTVDLRSPAAFVKVVALCLIQPGRFRNPQAHEPLFQRLHDAGFHTGQANLNGRGTFTPSRLIPSAFRPKLDWLALRGLAAAPGSAAMVPARQSLLGRRFSDHDFVTCVVET